MYGTRKESPTRRRRFRSMVRLSDAVFCGNAFLLSEAKKHKREHVFYVPTVVNTADYPVKDHLLAEPSVVGWIGGASTLRYLSDIAPLFASPPRNTIFKIVADKPPTMTGARTVFEKWSGEQEKQMLLSFDVGIMPVRDDIWSRGKCGLKLIQYCAAGLPSVSHPFGVSREIIEEGQSGFLRQHIEEWREAIERLKNDVSLRKRMGRRARAIAEERYSLKVWGPRVAGMIDSL
jgi:glycosyltransferase involved in cell wall biosynthesis